MGAFIEQTPLATEITPTKIIRENEHDVRSVRGIGQRKLSR
jgi:hypothetical protein